MVLGMNPVRAFPSRYNASIVKEEKECPNYNEFRMTGVAARRFS